ncbi:PspA/IM30 family protein [Marinobacterium rhizophilum]|uniref:PspA/IM30 family protein n=1 Tax=Marinobacterium rhizophilum TaxID=420402 RepID=A0ABY5HK62_9GAMM|nr:PspA/IM30 family protein [Marinobacterium rhizophilum]UTW11346.1 PspA/IM30 family protein [Marinobacterium rhizophilum]
MSLIKRLSTTFIARLDGIVGEIEDHEAVIQTRIDELRHKVAQAKARLNQMQREETQLQQRIAALGEDEDRWGRRAKSCAGEDPARALACIERRQQCRTEAQRLSAGLAGYRQSAERLARDVTDSESRLQELHQRHSIMRARQSGTAARAAVPEDAVTVRALETSFERWDARLSEQELRLGDISVHDNLDEAFSRDEQDAQLRAELDALLQEDGK